MKKISKTRIDTKRKMFTIAQHQLVFCLFLADYYNPKAQFYVAFILVFALIVCSGIPTFAARIASVEYVERSVDANGNVISTTKTAENCTWILTSVEELEDSKWYYADSRLAIPSIGECGL